MKNMKKSQKVVLAMTLILTGLIVLFPEQVLSDGTLFPGLGRGFLLEMHNHKVDVTRTLSEVVVVLFIGIGLIVLLGLRKG